MMNIDTIKLPDNLETAIGRKPFNKYINCPICGKQMGLEQGEMESSSAVPFLKYRRIEAIITLQYVCPDCYTKLKVKLKN